MKLIAEIVAYVEETIREFLRVYRRQIIQFQIIGGSINSDQYLYTFVHSGSFSRRSGDASNGYRYSNSAPATAAFTGKVVSATASITGLAQSTGSPAPQCELLFELWKVGFSNEGTKLGDIVFTVDSSTYDIGNWWNSSILTAFAESQGQAVSVEAGDLLGLKFNSQTGNNKIVSMQNATVVLEIVRDV